MAPFVFWKNLQLMMKMNECTIITLIKILFTHNCSIIQSNYNTIHTGKFPYANLSSMTAPACPGGGIAN